MTLRERFLRWLNGDVTEAPSSGGGGGAKRDPLASIIKKIGIAISANGTFIRDYVIPDIDFTQIEKAYDTESYVRQAVDKYIELMFKAGWDLVGKNQNSVDYIKLRFKLMAEMTQIPTEQLFVEIAEDLVKYSNVIIAKARASDSILAGTKTGIKVQGIGGKAPIGGYFPLNITTMWIKRDPNGTVKGWRQLVQGQGTATNFNPQDIIHIYYKREKGRAFGTPFLIPVLDDIRALRQAEENILRLIYRNLNPLLHIQVGTEGIPGQQGEVDTTKAEFESLDLEAGFVSTERVKITAVASNQIIDAKDYIKYFEQRVFTGLGVSELMMGRGNSANRSTGDNLTGEFADRVKALQKIMAMFVDEFMVKELLMEGGFDPVLNPDDDVDFVFKEIDIDAKIKAENHAIYQYEHNAVTEDEMRSMLGRDAITDRALMFMNLVTIPVAEASAAAKAAASPTAGTPSANNKNKPKNQHGTKPSPKKTAASATPFHQLYMTDMEDVFEVSQQAVTKLVDAYSANHDGQRLEEMKRVIRCTEEDLMNTMQHYLGIDYAKDFKVQIHRACEQVYEEIADVVLSMTGSQKNARIYETVAGIYHVMLMRVTDIAERAYESYISIVKEVE